MKYATAQETYFDLKGIIAFYERLGKTATADFFRSIHESGEHVIKEGKIVRQGNITWIPASHVRHWVELFSASPSHAKEVYQDIECHAIQWMPTPGDSQRELEQVYARIAAKNN